MRSVRMPDIGRFLGIIITMYYSDHTSPHFHAKYGQHEVKVELIGNWTLAQARRPLKKIAPLE